MSTTTGSALGTATARQTTLHRRIRWFVAATISYNVVEAVVAIAAGAAASSVALIGFGLDSVIEVTSAAAVAWQFTGKDPRAREATALRIIAWSFFALAAYVTTDAAMSLADGSHARHSLPGVILAALSLLIMPLLSYGQRRTGRELASRSAVADSKQTLLCTYLSAVLLVGLALNWLLGWSWADPVVALVIAVVALKEGRSALLGESCCAPTGALHPNVCDDTTPSACPTGGSTSTGGGPTGCEDECDCCTPVDATTKVAASPPRMIHPDSATPEN